jgi:anaerobic magnesium-protoporphyrin IX monomethyl ester cyclase
MGIKTKILLINPPITGEIGAGIGTIKTPLGLAYLAGYLEKEGYVVKILDCLSYYENIQEIKRKKYRVGLPEEDISKKIKDFEPDLVGISCSFTIYEEDSFRIANLVKTNSKALVVFGGAHSSANPHSVLQNKNVDLVVRGEGEIVFSEIAKNLLDKKALNSIPGTILKRKGKIVENKHSQFIKNLDEIPFPARHLIPMKKYLKHPKNAIANMRKPTTEIVTSRGCPFRCIFCSICTVWGRKWRARSAKNVIDEIEELHKKYGINEFRFFDDNISWDKKRMIAICEEIIQRKLDIKWDTPNGVAIATLNEEVLRKMKQAGYYRIVMGIESGSKKTLGFMRKPVNLQHAKKIIKICNKLGIWTWSTFVIGFPNETMEEIQKTIDFAKKSGLNFATFYVAQPYLGTEMYEIYKKEGLLKKGMKKESSITNTQYDTNYFSARELQEIQKKAYSEFIKHRMIRYLNPILFYKEFLNRIKSWEDINYVFRMIKNLIGQEYSPLYKKED